MKTFMTLLFFALLATAAYKAADNHHLIQHDQDTLTWVKGDWMVGEYRYCNLQPEHVKWLTNSFEPFARLYCGNQGNSYFQFTTEPEVTGFWPTDAKQFHDLPVHFHGKVEQALATDDFSTWRCQRNSDSLSCELNESLTAVEAGPPATKTP